jgi:phytol kinase
MTWKPDYTALLVAYAYVFGVIGVAELLRRISQRPPEFTRKFIHIGALIPPITFVIINALSYWRGTIRAMETEDRGNLGTIYFPISFTAVVYYYWSQPVLMVASLMPLTWGDALGAIIGQRYGHHNYTVGGRTRSVEGSVAMFFWSWVSTSLALYIMPYLLGRPLINWLLALIYGGAVALACTIVEALSPWGIDNLTIPVAAVLVLNALRN